MRIGASPANTMEGPIAILMIWNAAIHCTQVALDMIMVSLRCTLVYKPRGMERLESMTTPSRDLECLGAISFR
jgi:hypothetical protein